MGSTQGTQGIKQVANINSVCKVPNWPLKSQRTNWGKFREKPDWFSNKILWSFGKGKDSITQTVV